MRYVLIYLKSDTKPYKARQKSYYRRYISLKLKQLRLNAYQVPRRYKIEIITDATPAEGNTIGEVMLMRKNRMIDKAQLLTNLEVPDKEKLVYWKF